MRGWLLGVMCLLASASVAIIDRPTAERQPAGIFAPLGTYPTRRTCQPVETRSRSMSEVLGPTLRTIIVEWYDQPRGIAFDAVKDYINRLLVASPENGPQPGISWSNFVKLEILGVAEFEAGQPARIELGNGYARYEDASGCDWWARYLGPDSSKWTVLAR
jgi:hypothetical protein